MESKLSESLLPETTRDLKKAISLESCRDEEFSCNQVTYGTGDAVFSAFIVAPLVVSVWRGTWGIMDLHPKLFPYAQTFLLGIILHVCFAILRSQLLSRSVEVTQPPSPVSWFQERVVSRVYTYVFILSNIMHWRGGWGLLDALVAAIIPDASDPHRPVVIAAFVLVFYFCSVSLRSSRNLLASPYFLVTDGKEPTYFFTTRFQKKLATGLLLAQSLAMRGSTAGLADTLAGGSRAYSALLESADALFAAAVVAPAVVTYWKSTWTLLDLYALPDSPVASAASCAAAGLACNLLLTVCQRWLSRRLTPDRSRLTYYVLSRLYTCVAGVACVAAWRGVWNLLNECTGSSARTLLSTTAAATLSLAALRALRNVCAAPFAVAVDSPQDYFDIPTMFRTNSRERALYVLDCVFSVGVVGSLVVFVWRGSWALLDIFLFPEEQVKSCWSSLIAGYALVVVTFGLQAPVRWAAARLHGAPRLLLADLYHLISFFATVNVWRGVWGLLDVYFFPETPKLSNWCSHFISLAFLVLLNCSNSVLVRGVYIDAEEPDGECVVFPCHYLRLYFHKERTKKRHKRALAAAAAASRKSEDASLPLQIPEEKV